MRELRAGRSIAVVNAGGAMLAATVLVVGILLQ
jgi:hypothetical protein